MKKNISGKKTRAANGEAHQVQMPLEIPHVEATMEPDYERLREINRSSSRECVKGRPFTITVY